MTRKEMEYYVSPEDFSPLGEDEEIPVGSVVRIKNGRSITFHLVGETTPREILTLATPDTSLAMLPGFKRGRRNVSK